MRCRCGGQSGSMSVEETLVLHAVDSWSSSWIPDSTARSIAIAACGNAPKRRTHNGVGV